MKFFAQENSISVKDLEEALLQWRLKSTASKPTEIMSLNQNVKPTVPTFIEQVAKVKQCRNLSTLFLSAFTPGRGW